MKNAGFILKTGIVAFAAFVFSSNAYSQVSNQADGKQKNETYTATPAAKSLQLKETSVGTNNQTKSKSQATLNPSLAAQKRSAIVGSNPGNVSRNCETATRKNPYSISRANFDKLPDNRKQFILSNPKKYTIVD